MKYILYENHSITDGLITEVSILTEVLSNIKNRFIVILKDFKFPEDYPISTLSDIDGYIKTISLIKKPGLEIGFPRLNFSRNDYSFNSQIFYVYYVKNDYMFKPKNIKEVGSFLKRKLHAIDLISLNDIEDIYKNFIKQIKENFIKK